MLIFARSSSRPGHEKMPSRTKGPLRPRCRSSLLSFTLLLCAAPQLTINHPRRSSPIAIWSERTRAAPDWTAADKIEMMRTFGRDVLDVSNVNGDGWIVCQTLIASSALERCPANRSVHWMHSHKQDEEFVAMSTSVVWAALQ